MLYQTWLSPLFAWFGSRCRFAPRCSQFALDAFSNAPFWTAMAATVWRLLRCGPWSKGGHDPYVVRKAHVAASSSSPARMGL